MTGSFTWRKSVFGELTTSHPCSTNAEGGSLSGDAMFWLGVFHASLVGILS